jgi:hypothetical protein
VGAHLSYGAVSACFTGAAEANTLTTPRIPLTTIALLLATAVLPACQSTPQPSTAGSAPAAPTGTTATMSPPPLGTGPTAGAAGRGPAHVVVVVFENKADQQITRSAKAPWFNTLIASSAVFTDAHAVTHPSQPNYLALFSGSTQGVTDDHCPVRLPGVPNLGQQLLAAGHTFTGYSEDLPTTGFQGCSTALYARKHAPWVDFPDLPASVNQPLRALPTDYASLPTVSFVIPNLCHDMHNCPVATGDAWGRDHLDGYARWARAHNSVLIVTFDEDDNAAGNRILTLIAGGGVTPGTYPQRIDHYTVLRTIESWYGLPPVQRATTAAPLTVWTGQ